MAMTPLTGTPSRTMSQSAFDSACNDFFSTKLPLFVTEANALQTDVNSKQVAAATSASDATTQSGVATTQAGIATTQATLAGNWATQLGTPVSGGEYSAKYHAQAAAASAASAVTSPATQATSTTSMSIGSGSKAFTLAQTGKNFVVGQWVAITDLASPSANWMNGAITAFNSGTGDITVDVSVIAGSGTFSSWAISQSSPNLQYTYQGRDVRTSNVALTVGDIGKLIDITSGTFTQTFSAVSTLGNKWWCYIRNSGTGDITLDPNGSEQIDGLTNYVMYPGETRLVTCNGTGFYTIVLTGYYRTFTSGGAWTKPPGYAAHSGLLWGGGGGGARATGNNVYTGGGGGGACCPFSFNSNSLAATVTVTIGSGGAASITANVAAGTGGKSQFHTAVAYGGGGAYPTNDTSDGGSGGGLLSTGLQGQPGGSFIYGGAPVHAHTFGGVSTAVLHNTGFGGGSSAISNGGDSAYGGGAGAASGTAGRSIYGGGGGSGYESGPGGTSVFGGAGGTGFYGGSGNATSPGIPAGGGGSVGGAGTGAPSAGARGELRIWGEI